MSVVLSDIRDMQSGAKSRSESISDINFGPQWIQKHDFDTGNHHGGAQGTKMSLLRLAHIYIYIERERERERY